MVAMLSDAFKPSSIAVGSLLLFIFSPQEQVPKQFLVTRSPARFYVGASFIFHSYLASVLKGAELASHNNPKNSIPNSSIIVQTEQYCTFNTSFVLDSLLGALHIPPILDIQRRKVLRILFFFNKERAQRDILVDSNLRSSDSNMSP